MSNQEDMFGQDWEDEWQDMPEFIQEQQDPYSMINVRFANEEDLQEFAKLIGQPLTRRTQSIWHPRLVRGLHTHNIWVDDES